MTKLKQATKVSDRWLSPSQCSTLDWSVSIFYVGLHLRTDDCHIGPKKSFALLRPLPANTCRRRSTTSITFVLLNLHYQVAIPRLSQLLPVLIAVRTAYVVIAKQKFVNSSNSWWSVMIKEDGNSFTGTQRNSSQNAYVKIMLIIALDKMVR